MHSLKQTGTSTNSPLRSESPASVNRLPQTQSLGESGIVRSTESDDPC